MLAVLGALDFDYSPPMILRHATPLGRLRIDGGDDEDRTQLVDSGRRLTHQPDAALRRQREAPLTTYASSCAGTIHLVRGPDARVAASHHPSSLCSTRATR